MQQRADIPRLKSRLRHAPRQTAAVALLLLAGALAGCAGDGPTASGTPKGALSAATLLQIADDTQQNGDPATAVSLYRQLHEMSPHDPVPLARLGAALMTLQDFTDSAGAWHAALELAPENSDFHRGLALALLAQGETAPAVTELQAALAKRGGDARLFNALGVAHDMMGRRDLAQLDYKHGLKLAPENPGLRNNYALSLALAGDYTNAIALLGGIAANPDAPARYRLNLALIYGLAGDDIRAEATARQVLDDASVRNNLGYYAVLRSMDAPHRAAAVIGLELHGAAGLAGPVQPAIAAAPKTTPVEATPLAPPLALASPPQADTPAVVAPSQPASEKSAGLRPVQLRPDPAAAVPGSPPAAAHVEPSQTNSPQAESNAADSVPAKSAQPAATTVGPQSGAAAPPENLGMESAVGLPAVPPFEMTASARPLSLDQHFVIQLTSCLHESSAQSVVDAFGEKGIPVAMTRFTDAQGREWYRVRTPELATSEDAVATLHRIQALGLVEPLLIRRHTLETGDHAA